MGMVAEPKVGPPATATARAHPNLALVKYWGRRDPALNLPANGSISLNLSGAVTTTMVVFDRALVADIVVINGEPADDVAQQRVTAHLDRVRTLANLTERATVVSDNTFPTSAGVASSSSAFAALTRAAVAAAGLELSLRELSILARKGSGSAARSIPDGFVEWLPGHDDESSYAFSLAPCDYWDVHVITVAWPLGPKAVPSLAGHDAVSTSPFYEARLALLPRTLDRVREAIAQRDLGALGMVVEREAMSLHAVAMTSQPAARPWMSGVTYFAPETIRMIQAIQEWRERGLEVYFTLDAGPSVHLLCAACDVAQVVQAVRNSVDSESASILVSRAGRGAWLVNQTGGAAGPAGDQPPDATVN